MRSIAIVLVSLIAPIAANSQEVIASGLMGTQGSAIGPDGHLYVTEGAYGRISKVNRWTGEISTFHEGGLPLPVIGVGGVVDVVFVHGTAYALVTLVSDPLFSGTEADGIYRIDGPSEATLIADLGTYTAANPSESDVFLVNGVFYALEAYDGGFLVTDGHHNRVLKVSKYGKIRVFRSFGNIVPTGLETYDDAVFIAHAGPTPHLPENGGIDAFWPKLPFVLNVASGAPLMVDVELGRDRTLFGLAQGPWGDPATNGKVAGDPADPNGGSLVAVDADRNFEVIAEGLNQPTSLEIIGNDAYVVTLTGEVIKIADVLSRHRRDKHHDYH